MPDGGVVIEHRQFPIGAMPSTEVAGILANPLCKEQITLDMLMQEWKQKSQTFSQLPQPDVSATDSDLQPLGVTAAVQQKIDAVISSYRNLLPPIFELALVPVAKLVTPQRSVIIERARNTLGGRTTQLSVDEIAEYCLGTPAKVANIDAMFLNQNQKSPNEVQLSYQFSSADQDVRPLLPSPFSPFRKTDWSAPGARHQLHLQTIPFAVGPGQSTVIVAKVPAGNVISTPFGVTLTIGPGGPALAAPQPTYRLILLNGVHRVFRLAELGHTHVAAVVSPTNVNELAPLVVDTPREMLLAQRPLLVSDLTDSAIAKSFEWKKASRVYKLQITIQSDQTFI